MPSPPTNPQESQFKALVTKVFAPYSSSVWLSFESTCIFIMVWILSFCGIFISATYGMFNIALNVLRIVREKPISRYASPKHIFITGASSGLGEHLAYHYTKESAKTIYLCSRTISKIEHIAVKCHSINPKVNIHCVEGDVTNEKTMHDALLAADNATPLDLVIANAGVSHSTLPDSMPRPARFRTILDTNVQGVLNTIFPLLDRFKARMGGQFMVVASIAAIAQLPGYNPYAASKVAALSLGQSFRQELKPFGVGVTTICPGFVRSAMTEKRHETQIKGGLPMFMEADPAVKIMADGTAADLPVVIFPLVMGVSGWIMRFIPFQFHDIISTLVSRRMYIDEESTKEE